MANDADVSVGADLSPLDRGLRAAQAKLQSWGAGLMKIGIAVEGTGYAIVGGLLAATYAFSEMGSDMKDMSDRTGIAVEALSELRHAAEQGGASAEDMEIALKGMSKLLAGVAGGDAGMAKKLEELNLSVDDFKGLHPDQAFELLAQKISEIDNPMQRAAMAMEVFGKSGMKMLPMMADGAAGIRKLREEAQRMGVSMSGPDADAAESLGDQISLLTKQFKYLVFHIGAAVAPIASKFLSATSEAIAGVIHWIKNNRELIAMIFKLGTALIFTGGMIGKAGLALYAIAYILPFVVSPLGLLIGLLGTAAAAVVYFSGTGSDLAQFGSDFGGGFMETLQGVLDALSSGNFELAARIGFLGIQIAWQDVYGSMEQTAIAVVESIFKLWDDVIKWLIRAWINASSFIATEITNAFTAAAVAWEQLQNTINPLRTQETTDANIAEHIAQRERVIQNGAQRMAELERMTLGMAPLTGVNPGDALNQAVNQSRVERDDLLSELQIAQIQAAMNAVSIGLGGPRGQAPELDASLGMGSLGSFSAAAVSGFGSGPMNRLVNAAENQEEILGEIRDNMGEGGGIWAV